MAEQKLPKGLRFFNRRVSQPDFVVGSMVITLNDLVTYAKENPDLLTEYNGQKQLKIQLLKSKDGNLYGAVDMYKPAAAAPATPPTPETDLPF
jgi:hypothetical protein